MYKELLKKIAIFKDLSDETLSFIEKNLEIQPYHKNDIIFSETDQAEGVFFVKTGTVRLTKSDDTGKEIIVCLKKSGDLFAEVSLFAPENSTYPATAHMIQDGEVLFLKSAALEREIFTNPELGIEIIRFMSNQLRNFTVTLRDIALLDVYNKTVSTLDRLAKDFGEENQDGLQIELPLTVQEFANIIGARRESVSRVFSKLKNENIIRINEKKIVISNMCKFCSLDKV